MQPERDKPLQALADLRQDLNEVLERAHGQLLLARRALAQAERRIMDMQADTGPVAHPSRADARARGLPDDADPESIPATP
jgi:hypothetical protein